MHLCFTDVSLYLLCLISLNGCVGVTGKDERPVDGKDEELGSGGTWAEM